jgi:hypothetical protein
MTLVLHQSNDMMFIFIAIPICLTLGSFETMQTLTVLLLARLVHQL